ncbi:MAG: sporulation initiation factor Spo0A C-terminal domain-containing protein [Clostridia bacterium]|nr:sporulation initiation factor Spo0A C-terminal domain-containing protein [Clostridia bacterium]
MDIAICAGERSSIILDYLSDHDAFIIKDARKLRSIECGAIIIDVAMRGADAFQVIDEVGADKCIVIVPEHFSFLSSFFASKGAAVVQAERLFEQLPKAVLGLGDEAHRQLGDRIRRVLDEFGIRRSIRGYSCLLDAVMIAAKDKGAITSMRSNIYEPVAALHSSTPVKVERVMRFAIESAMARARVDVVVNMFGYSLREMTGKPTNSEFIARAAELVR